METDQEKCPPPEVLDGNIERALLQADQNKEFNYYDGLKKWIGRTECYRNWTGAYIAMAEHDLGPGAHLKSIILKITYWPMEVNQFCSYTDKFLTKLPKNITQQQAQQYVNDWICVTPETIDDKKKLLLECLPGLPEPAVNRICDFLFVPISPLLSKRYQSIFSTVLPYLPSEISS